MLKENSRFFLFSLVLVFFLASTKNTSAIDLHTSLTTSKFSVGDRIHFSVSTFVPKEHIVTPPPTETDFGKLTVKEWNVRKNETENGDSLFYDYIITTYIPEPCTIPSLSYLIEHQTTVDTFFTEPIPLTIISVLPNDTVDIIGLKDPLSAGNAPRWWLWTVLVISAIAIIIVVTTALIRHFKKPPPLPPPIPPYEEAIDALNALGVKKYLQRGLIREYVFELSDIFKRYLGRRYNCNATDFTSEEMFAWSSAMSFPKEQRSCIEWFFKTTDPVKFARAIPNQETIDRFNREIRNFLEATKPIPEKNTDEKESDSTISITEQNQKSENNKTSVSDGGAA